MFVLDDDIFITEAGERKRYKLDAAARQILVDFDRGVPASALLRRDFRLLLADSKTAN